MLLSSLQVSNHANFIQRMGLSFEIEAKRAAIIYALSDQGTFGVRIASRLRITLVSDKAMKGLQTDILFAAGQCAFVGVAKLVLDHDAFIQLEARERYIRREGARPQMSPIGRLGGGRDVERGLLACSSAGENGKPAAAPAGR